MRIALPVWMLSRRHRSATLIRRRTAKRPRRFWPVAALIAALAGVSVIVTTVTGAPDPRAWIGGLASLPIPALADTGPVDEGPALLAVRSQPAGARVVLDGRDRGRTPLDLHTGIGQHVLLLERDSSLGTVELVDVPAAGAAIDVALWARQPTVKRLHPAYPGSHLSDATFLSDGRVQLTVVVPDQQAGQPGSQSREAWLVDPAPADRGPSAAIAVARAAAVAVSPDGNRVATLQDASRVQPPPRSVRIAPNRLDSVWVGTASTRTGPGTQVFRLDPPAQTAAGGSAQEQLSGVAWLPDSGHLLVASRYGDAATGGPLRTRLVIVDADTDGDVRSAIDPVELIALPAEALLQSAVWSPDAQHVAVLLRATSARGVKRQLGLGVLNVSQPGAGPFQYVADLGPDDTPGGRLPVAPVAWQPCAADGSCGAEQRMVYTAPVPTAAPGGLAGPLNLLGLVRPASAAAGAVFVSSISAPALAAGDAPRLGNAAGIIGPVWRSRATGVDGAPLVGFARGAGGALSLRAIDPLSGRLQDLGIQLPPDVARGANAIGVRWDVVHARALVLARTSVAGTDGAIDAWLVDFRPASADPRP